MSGPATTVDSVDTTTLPSSPASPSDALVVYETHVGHPPVTSEVAAQCDALRAEIVKDAVYAANQAAADAFLTQQNLHRYLRARQFDLPKAKKLLLASLQWRMEYRPSEITAAEVEPECATGKIRVLPHLDRHARPIIVMDSSRENSKNHDSQLRHLTWQLERASRKMNDAKALALSNGGMAPSTPPPFVEKYIIFINMERSSIWNSPPLKTSLETLKTLTERYPEHLGHAVVYKPGMLFAGLWAACKPVMDAKTVSKIVFIRGDCSDGSKNDATLRSIIGDQWRAWCDVPKDDYDHAAFWKEVLQDEADWNAKQQHQQAATALTSAAAAAPAAATTEDEHAAPNFHSEE